MAMFTFRGPAGGFIEEDPYQQKLAPDDAPRAPEPSPERARTWRRFLGLLDRLSGETRSRARR
jgi:hypothetical protein